MHRFSMTTGKCVWCHTTREAVDDRRKAPFCAEVPPQADEARWADERRSAGEWTGY